MTLTVDLPPELEARFADKARTAGMDIRTYAGKLVETEARRPSLRELSGPIADAVRESGISEEELGEMLERAKHEMRAERRVREGK